MNKTKERTLNLRPQAFEASSIEEMIKLLTSEQKKIDAEQGEVRKVYTTFIVHLPSD